MKRLLVVILLTAFLLSGVIGVVAAQTPTIEDLFRALEDVGAKEKGRSIVENERSPYYGMCSVTFVMPRNKTANQVLVDILNQKGIDQVTFLNVGKPSTSVEGRDRLLILHADPSYCNPPGRGAGGQEASPNPGGNPVNPLFFILAGLAGLAAVYGLLRGRRSSPA